MKGNVDIADLVMAILLAVAGGVAIYIASHTSVQTQFSWGWANAAATLMLVILVFFQTLWVWRMCRAVMAFIGFLTGKTDDIRSELRGAYQWLINVVQQESERLANEN